MKTISIICVNENAALETVALRGVLEYLGYVPSIHWVGSVQQFKTLLNDGKKHLSEWIVLSAHGCKEGFYGTGNEVVSLKELTIKLPKARVLSLGCMTGTEPFAKAFLNGGADCYIAPPSSPEGNSALMFALLLLWQVHEGKDVTFAWKQASMLLADKDDRFRLFRKVKNGMSVDGKRDIPL
ncbi:MAG: hypothetical protein ABIG34_04380 [Candidatus Peregrinibacteria bacterium]